MSAPDTVPGVDAVALDDRTVQVVEPPVVGRCDGDPSPGDSLAVTLVSARAPAGPEFAVAAS